MDRRPRVPLPLGAVTGDEHAAVVEAQATTIADPLGVEWTFEVRAGDPAFEPMQAAIDHQADTIVIAGRGRTVPDTAPAS